MTSTTITWLTSIDDVTVVSVLLKTLSRQDLKTSILNISINRKRSGSLGSFKLKPVIFCTLRSRKKRCCVRPTRWWEFLTHQLYQSISAKINFFWFEKMIKIRSLRRSWLELSFYFVFIGMNKVDFEKNYGTKIILYRLQTFEISHIFSMFSSPQIRNKNFFQKVTLIFFS